jgi:hypothetical protein
MLRLRLTRRPQPARLVSLAAVALVAIAPAATSSRGWVDGVDRWAIAPARTAVVGYHSLHALRQALREHHGTLVRAIPALGLAEISPSAQPRYFASATVDLPGIDYVEPPVVRHENADPALQPASTSIPGGIPEWQYFATRVNEVPAFVLRAASRLTIAVIDTGPTSGRRTSPPRARSPSA